MNTETFVEHVAVEGGFSSYEEAEAFVFSVLRGLAHLMEQKDVVRIASRFPGEMKLLMTREGSYTERLTSNDFLAMLEETEGVERSSAVAGLKAFFRVLYELQGRDVVDVIMEYLPRELREIAWLAEHT